MKLTESVASTILLRNTAVHIFILLLFFLLFAAKLQAAESEEPLGISSLLKKGLTELVELDVSLSTGTPKALRSAPSVATVITAADIEAMGAATLDDVLESVPGIHVMPSPLSLFTSNWEIRGITSKVDPQVLLLINGQPIRTNSNGSKPQTFRMPVSMISRIEIIRGPGSAILGADAFAGAVNVITKEAAEIAGTKSGIRVGSFDAQDYWAQQGALYNGWEVSVGAEYQKGAGDKNRIISSLVSAPGHSAQTPGPLDTHYNVLDTNLLVRKDDWAFRIYYNEAFDNGEGPGINQTYTPESFTKYRWVNTSLTWQREDLLPDFDASVTLRGNYFWDDNYYQFFPNSIQNMIGSPAYQERNGGLELTGLYHGSADNRVRASAGVTNYDTETSQQKNYGPGITNQYGALVDISNTPYVYMTNHSRRLWYAALQDAWSFAKDWELTAGARYDRYSDFGTSVNPRVALVWSATPELTSKLLYGKAFRAPAFQELYLQNNPTALGNASLDPERIDTIELAFDYKPIKTLRLGFNMFEYKIKGLIDYVQDPAPATSKTAQNVNDQDGNGFELEADWLATDAVRVRGNYAYQHAWDTNTHHVMPDVPRQKIWADADWSFLPHWSANTEYIWVGDRQRAAGDTRPEIRDYELVNLTLHRRNLMNHLDLAFSVRNVFDKDAREPAPPVVPDDYPLERRSYWAEVRYTF